MPGAHGPSWGQRIQGFFTVLLFPHPLGIPVCISYFFPFIKPLMVHCPYYPLPHITGVHKQNVLRTTKDILRKTSYGHVLGPLVHGNFCPWELANLVILFIVPVSWSRICSRGRQPNGEDPDLFKKLTRSGSYEILRIQSSMTEILTFGRGYCWSPWASLSDKRPVPPWSPQQPQGPTWSLVLFLT